MGLYSSEYTLHDLNVIAGDNGSTCKKKKKKLKKANGLVEVHNDDITAISKITCEREPWQSSVIFKTGEMFLQLNYEKTRPRGSRVVALRMCIRYKHPVCRRCPETSPATAE